MYSPSQPNKQTNKNHLKQILSFNPFKIEPPRESPQVLSQLAFSSFAQSLCLLKDIHLVSQSGNRQLLLLNDIHLVSQPGNRQLMNRAKRTEEDAEDKPLESSESCAAMNNKC